MSAPKLKRTLYGPLGPEGASHGRDVLGIKRGYHAVEENFYPYEPGGPDDVWNAKAVDAMKTKRMLDDRKLLGPFRQDDLDAVWPYMDLYGRWLYRTFTVPKPKPPPPTICYPYAIGEGGSICQGLHPTAGLLGNWAIDFCESPNDPILCVEGGTIQRLSGHSPSEDQWDTQGIFGWNVYVRTSGGYQYFYTHIGRRDQLVEGEKVLTGQRLGWVGDQHFRPDHIHIGVTSPLGISDAKKRIEAVSRAPRVQ